MSMENKGRYGKLAGNPDGRPSGIGGGVLLLCCMSALCLAVLAMLAMSSARAHKAASDACLAETAGYYAACLEADRALASWRQAGGDGTFEERFHISDAQELHVLAIDGDIVTWAPVPSGGWEADEYIEVIQ